MKKIYSFLTIITITALFGGVISFVRAYVEPSVSPNAGNPPAPILTGPVTFGTGVPDGFFKQGKIGTTNDKTNNPVDTNQFSDSTLVVMGQLSSNSLTSAYSNRIRAELAQGSPLFALTMGNPQGSLFQTNTDGSAKTFLVKDHTRAARMVIGSLTANAGDYNLYVEPGAKATNFGISPSAGGYGPNSTSSGYADSPAKTSFCKLTSAKLASGGCPAGKYLDQIFPIADANGNVAVCRELIISSHYNSGYGGNYYSPNYDEGLCP